MSFYTYTLTENDLTKLCNQVKELFVESLVVNKFLTNEQSIKIKENYAVIIKKKNWFGVMWDKVRGAEEDGMQIAIVKCALGPDCYNDETTENEEDAPVCEAEG